jgi:sugar lactone lactonase YvrE
MRRLKLTIASLMLSAVFALMAAPSYAGNAPYNTLKMDPVYGAIPTQDAFLPAGVIETFGETDLRAPSDIAFSREGHMYIADTGNKRVIECLPDGTLIAEYGADILNYPTGIHVNGKGELYVADQRNKAVYLFDNTGALITEYTRPGSFLYGDANDFAPKKVAADETGNVYIISEGNTNGVIQLSREGDFFGYVGANATRLTLRELVQRITFTDAQASQLRSNVPMTPNNLCTDTRGLVYTVTQGGMSDGLKKLNLASQNMLRETNVDYYVNDVCVGGIENIFTVSSQGYIYEYDREGQLLFIFGGRDDGNNRDGLFVTATGIAADNGGNLYVLDSDRNAVTRFEQTQFAATVHEALDRYQNGLYLESKDPWERAMRQDSLFNLGYRGIGEAFYKLEDYGASMEAFRNAYYLTGYSEAFWEVRNAWLMSNLTYIIVGIIGLFVLTRAVRYADRRAGILNPVRNAGKALGGVKLLREIGFMTKLPRNPADAFYGIKFEGRTSVLSATCLYALFFVVFLLDKYASGWLFKTVVDDYYEFGTDFASVFGVIATVVVCNHLVCSINDGEGKFRHVYMGLAYCLTPYILLQPPLIIISNVLTLNESFVVNFGSTLIAAAVAVLVIIMVKEIQDYTFWGTIRSLLLTAFTSLMLVVTGVIIFSLINQVVDFIYAVIIEVYFRAG